MKGQSLPIVFAGLGKPADFTGKDLNGKIALIQRGEITFDEKIKNAKSAGAKAVIVYNNEDGQIPAYWVRASVLFHLSACQKQMVSG